MLKFLGNGSAFNTEFYNTSAFIVDNTKMLLIDCGETTFSRLKNLNLLNDITEINVCITHLHSDHIGSLPSLILYMHYIKKIKVNIIYDKNVTYIESLRTFLTMCDCIEMQMYEFCNVDKCNFTMGKIQKIEFVKCIHSPGIDAFSVKLYTSKGLIYYSGDTNDIIPIVELLNSNENILRIYIDTCSSDYPGNVHLSFKKLSENISQDKKSYIYCIHLDTIDLKQKISNFGFNVPELV